MSSPAVWALALALGAPALVQAQTQLFPLAPIQRERVPCPMEDPVYGLYRQQYFGYFPTCWRAFPPGWGCPSPEAPNSAAEFAKRKRDPLPPNLEGPEEPMGPEPIPGEEPGGMRGRPAAPPVPGGERNPFSLDPNAPTGQPGGAAPPPRDLRPNPPTSRRTEPPQAMPGIQESSGETAAPLLALPDPTDAAPATPATTPGTRAGADPHDPNGGFPAPMPVTAPSGSSTALPAMPNPSTPGTMISGAGPGAMPPPAFDSPVSGPPAMPVQAPQRRGPISSLFNGMTSWIRR